MNYIYIAIGILLLTFIISLITSYFLGKSLIGEKAVKQNLLISLIGMAVGIVIVLPFFILKNGFQAFGFFQILLAIAAISFLFFHHFKNRNFMGSLVKTFSSSQQYKVLFWIGIFEVVLQSLLLLFRLPSLSRYSPDLANYLLQIAPTLGSIVLGASFIYFGTRKTEVYDNGIFVMGIFVRWEKISEYKFEAIRQNTFRAKYKSDVPFIPGTINLAFSDSDKTDFVQILQTRLPNLEPKS